ncbi:MAG: hypothetical protein AB8G77_03550 [Rhodothermales bacterium]
MLLAVTISPFNWHEVISRAVSENVAPIERCGAIISVLRACAPKARTRRFEELCEYLEATPASAKTLSEAVCDIVAQSDITLLLTESGVPDNKGFAGELLHRLERRIVPDLDDPKDLRTSLRKLFCKSDDHKWVKAVPGTLWSRLLAAMDIGGGEQITINKEWATSARILSHHIASLGLYSEVTQRLTHLDDADSPFLQLPEDTTCYINVVKRGDAIDAANPCLQAALEATKQCQMEVEQLRAEKSRYGTSLRLTALSFRLLKLISRLEILLKLTVASKNVFRTYVVRLFREVVEAENTRDHIGSHIKKNGDLLAYQIVEHAAKKGSKYITTGRQDYWRFFVASLGGGLIVAIFAMFKLLLKQTGVPLGIEAILFGINYSVCFVIIYLTGSALATKQPAMTANTLARSLERNEEDLQLEKLEDLIVQVWRSQFISFVGNLMMAFPVALALSYLFHHFTGAPIVDEAISAKLLNGINPWESGALIYAAVAGVFLFFSGLVAGWIDNRNLYWHYPERIARHPVIVRFAGVSRARRMGAFLDRNLGIIAGNVVLGFCLGSTATIGEILGLPIDIRHIAFSSAEYGVSLEVLGQSVPYMLILNAALGVMLIGLVNFLVSFGLSLFMALESRQVRFGETGQLLAHLTSRLVRRPSDWFFPPRQ